MLEKGAETIVEQCLKIEEDDIVVIVNDGNDQDLIGALIEKVAEKTTDYKLVEYEEPGEHGEEPPEKVAEKMRESDVFIAPTKKSISHTDARRHANENGARGATLPGINKEIWNTSLQADYMQVKNLSEKVYKLLESTDVVRIETSSGTSLEIDIDIDYFHTDTGIFHEPGDFGNLPAGEADGGALNARGTLVVDHAPFLPKGNEGAELEIKNNEVVSLKAENSGKLKEALENVEGAKNIAELGIGTNPETELIGNLLNDEKVLGTVHIAIGDNGSYMPEDDPRHVNAGLHWDFVCKNPTVYFDDRKVLDNGEPIFIDQ